MGTDTPLSPPETTATVQPPGLTLEEYAAKKGLPVEKLRQWGLSTQDGTVRIPYFGIDGRESAVRYRRSLAGPKRERFRWRKGSKPTLYGLERLADARAHGSIVVVEGESDCHTLWHHEYPAVGVPGASTFKSEWLTHLDDIPTIYHRHGTRRWRRGAPQTHRQATLGVHGPRSAGPTPPPQGPQRPARR